MTIPIQALPIDVIHLMVAGEVIDSLAAVVRELAENAVDANATRINIALWTDLWRIRVTDNGRGMTRSDLQQAALPHSTSKIRSRADLWQVSSLGFRGEALHSLAQLTHLEICSRTELETNRTVGNDTEGNGIDYDLDHDLDYDTGYRISYDHQGQPQEVQPIALASGTSVTASDLFANWPSRRHSFPIAQQLRAVQQVVQHLALCHPHITWQVEHNERPWLAIWGSAISQSTPQAAQTILTQLLRVQPADLQTVILNLQPARLALLLGLPDRCHRRRPDWLKVAINGRMVQFPPLEQTLLNSLRRTLPRDRYPVCFLHLHLPPTQVDWNRHPAKTEIYLRDLEHWQTQVQTAVTQALSLTEFPDSAHSTRLGQFLKTAEAEGVYRTSRSIEPTEPTSSPALLLQEKGAELVQSSTPLKALTQVHNTYILAEHSSGMWLVEQHIAHERVLYEQLCERWKLVPLEVPLVLGQLSELQQAQLQRLGIEVEPFGEQRWAVRSAPETLASREDCTEALLELSQGGDLESALVATACRTAIRNGTTLSLPEMQTLIDQWQATRSPRTCPHGRPIYLSLEESSLARFFRRHWVIGKSHGI
jgi:DNA mismatch repair protein MutL